MILISERSAENLERFWRVGVGLLTGGGVSGRRIPRPCALPPNAAIRHTPKAAIPPKPGFQRVQRLAISE